MHAYILISMQFTKTNLLKLHKQNHQQMTTMITRRSISLETVVLQMLHHLENQTSQTNATQHIQHQCSQQPTWILAVQLWSQLCTTKLHLRRKTRMFKVSYIPRAYSIQTATPCTSHYTSIV